MHKLLLRQLKRLSLNHNKLPQDSDQWQKFLELIHNTYIDADQERYLTERSIEISSREMSELNQKLENAQRIANLGYWHYERSSQKISFSKEILNLLDIKAPLFAISFRYILKMVFIKDRPLLKKMVRQAFKNTGNYECEIRLMNSRTSLYHWYHIRVYSDFKENSSYAFLTGIFMDITQRKNIEEEIMSLNQQVIQSARLAGMADVAISILHNVGNILNSINVSLSLLHENFQHSHYDNFFKVGDMLETHADSLINYLTVDSKGKFIPNYMMVFIKIMKTEHTSSLQEVQNLIKHIQHIQDIISMQQTVSKLSSMSEKLCASDMMEIALQINGEAFSNKNFRIIKEYKTHLSLITDKTKLLQILVNLIQNAKDAVMMNDKIIDKKVYLRTQEDKETQKISFIVKDNGIGITPENIKKIFTFGFTTKKEGHGFGMHNSILAAKELGGELTAESLGLNQGALFTLTLPFTLHNTS